LREGCGLEDKEAGESRNKETTNGCHRSSRIEGFAGNEADG
jgi:hypothetical protein